MRRALAVILLAATVVVAGCGSDESSTGASGVTVTHAFGSTQVPPDPKRIVALSFEEDALSTLGLRTVGRADNAYVAGEPYPWQRGRVDLSRTAAVVDANGSVRMEKIAALNPDLILATNIYGLDNLMYQKLSEIAPTVAFRKAVGEADWQELATQVGEAVGRPDEMAAQVRKVEVYLSGLAREFPGLRGKTFAGTYHYAPGQFRVNTDPDAQTARVLGRLGMSMNTKLTATAVDGSLSPERLDLLDVDLLVISFASPGLRTSLEAAPLYANLNAVRDGRVFVGDNFTATAGNNPTVLDIPWLLGKQREVLAKVAAS